MESRATSAPISTPADSVTLIASTEPWEVDRGALAGGGGSAREPSGAAACSAWLDGRRRSASPRELVLAADQFIITPAGRAEEAARARAAGEEVRTVIAGYHWFTDWGRDTMISLEGLTLSTRRLPRGRLHPAHVRALRARRADPQHVPRRRARRAVSHRRRDAVVLPRGRIATSAPPATRDTLRTLLPELVDIVRHHLAGHAVRHRRRSRRRPAAAGRGGLPAHVDGREGRRLGGHAAARQGGRDQRALVQRAAACSTAGSREHGGGGRSRSRRRTRSARARRSTRASGTPRAAISTTSSTASTATIRRAGRTRCSPSRSIIRCSTRVTLGGGHERRAEPPADAGRPALAGARPSRLQGQVLRRPAVARRRLPSGHGLGLADRPVRRRVAEAAPRGPRGSARAPRWLRGAPDRGVRRLHQRDLRRRRRRTPRAAASRRRGASRKCSGSWRRRSQCPSRLRACSWSAIQLSGSCLPRCERRCFGRGPMPPDRLAFRVGAGDAVAAPEAPANQSASSDVLHTRKSNAWPRRSRLERSTR